MSASTTPVMPALLFQAQQMGPHKKSTRIKRITTNSNLLILTESTLKSPYFESIVPKTSKTENIFSSKKISLIRIIRRSLFVLSGLAQIGRRLTSE